MAYIWDIFSKSGGGRALLSLSLFVQLLMQLGSSMLYSKNIFVIIFYRQFVWGSRQGLVQGTILLGARKLQTVIPLYPFPRLAGYSRLAGGWAIGPFSEGRSTPFKFFFASEQEPSLLR